MRSCIRCGRNEEIEEHHIVERCRGGGDEAENKECRCSACHEYEHTRRKLLAALEYEKRRGQLNRIRVYEHRLEILNKLNTPELVKERGKYMTYWADSSTRYLPRRIPTPEKDKLEFIMQLALSEEMKRLSI